MILPSLVSLDRKALRGYVVLDQADLVHSILARQHRLWPFSLFRLWTSYWSLQKIAICSPSCILRIPHSASRIGRMSAWSRRISIVFSCMSCNLDRKNSQLFEQQNTTAMQVEAQTREMTTYHCDSYFALASQQHRSGHLHWVQTKKS